MATYLHMLTVGGRTISMYTWLKPNESELVTEQFTDIAVWVRPLREFLEENNTVTHISAKKSVIPKTLHKIKGAHRLCTIRFWHNSQFIDVVVNPIVRGYADKPWIIQDEAGYSCTCLTEGLPIKECKVHHFDIPTHDLICDCLDNILDSYNSTYYDPWKDIESTYPLLPPESKKKEEKRYKPINFKAEPRKD